MTSRAALAWACAMAVVVTPTVTGSQQAFRLRVDAVAVPVSVQRGNAPVAGLTVDDFELFDNGVRQTLTTLSSGSTPLDVTVVLDTSGSVEGDLLERLTAEARATDVLGPEDRLRLLTFGTTVHESVPLGPVQRLPPAADFATGGATAFFHAVLSALLGETTAGRPHLAVALSDGLDNLSLLGVEAVRDVARHSNVTLHVVLPGVRRLELTIPADDGILRYLDNTGPTAPLRFVRGWLPFLYAGDLRRLREAAEMTGGSLRTPPVGQPPGDSLTQVLTEFRSAYVLWYSPTGVDREGWHDLIVRVNRPGHETRARQGYFSR